MDCEDIWCRSVSSPKDNKTMQPSQDFSRLYTDISNSIATALADISELDVKHKDGKRELAGITEMLQTIRGRFDGELKLLEENAEWDRFTIAFFGETNAGKSTIIESLRILFNEESRRQLLEKNAGEFSRYQEQVSYHVQRVREALAEAYADHASELMGIQTHVAALSQVVHQESSRKFWLTVAASFIAGGAATALLVMLAGT